MPYLPPHSVKLYLREFVNVRKNASQRIIAPSGFQYEITHDMVELYCPICNFCQDAPAVEGLDYQCPQCKWAYKVYGDMLVLWNPKSLGVQTPLHPPGTTPDRILDEAQDQADPEKVRVAYEKSIAKWKREGEDYGLRIQTQVAAPEGGRTLEQEAPHDSGAIEVPTEGQGRVPDRSSGGAGEAPPADNPGSDKLQP